PRRDICPPARRPVRAPPPTGGAAAAPCEPPCPRAATNTPEEEEIANENETSSIRYNDPAGRCCVGRGPADVPRSEHVRRLQSTSRVLPAGYGWSPRIRVRVETA